MSWEPSPPSDLCGAADPSLPRSTPRPSFSSALARKARPFRRHPAHALARVAASIAAVVPRDGGGSSFCMMGRCRRRRKPLYRLRGNYLCQSPPPPRLLQRAEPGNPTQSARRSRRSTLTTAHNQPEFAALFTPGASRAVHKLLRPAASASRRPIQPAGRQNGSTARAGPPAQAWQRLLVNRTHVLPLRGSYLHGSSLAATANAP